MNHLAIYNAKAYGDDYIELMLNGSKTVDSKFTYRKVAPYGYLKKGDIIYFKESSGPIRGRARVGSVVQKELADSDEVMNFLAPHGAKIGIKNEEHLLRVWKHNADKKYVCQWTMENPQRIDHPVYIVKRSRQIWVPSFKPPEEVLVAFGKDI